MYKVPKFMVGIVMPNPDIDPDNLDQHIATADTLDQMETFGFGQYSVGSLLCVKYHGRFYVTTYYWMGNRREAEMDAARNGFPFIADENDRALKVGLLARLYRAIIV